MSFAQKAIPRQTVVACADEANQLQSRDELDLARHGKRQQLQRRFGSLSVFGLTCTLMATWEALLIVLGGAVENGGSLGVFCSWLFVWSGVLTQALVMAEMASMIPVAGGQYNWVAVLAPPRFAVFLSYLTGWITFIAWQALASACAYGSAAVIQALIHVNHPAYTPQAWQTVLLMYASYFLAVFLNTGLARLLPQIESSILLLHIFGFVAVLIPLAYLGPKLDASVVFGTFINGGGWATKGLSFLVGTNLPMLCFVGFDSASHIAEEVHNAASVIPKAMIFSVMLNGVTGFAILIVALFNFGDFEITLNTPLSYAFLAVFQNSIGSAGGATGLSIIVVLVNVFANIGTFTAASRMLWAFARERGVPGYTWVSKVHRPSKLPLFAIGVTFLVNMLLALLNLGSDVAFNAFTSLVVAAQYSVFLLAAGSLLWRKLSGIPTRYGPFRLGRLSIPLIGYSMSYSVVGVFFSFWPQQPSPSLAQMNWAILIFGAVVLFACVYWLVWGRKVYHGPIIEIEVDIGLDDPAETSRDGSVSQPKLH